MKKKDIGKHGESLASAYIIRKGLHVLDRNVYSRVGEIDIVAKKSDVYHFIEVKTRLGNQYGNALESLSKKKIKNLIRLVHGYVKKNNLVNVEISVDLLAVDIGESGEISIEWIQNITL